MNEHEHQVALFNWARYNEVTYPELTLLYANPLGGKRPKRTAARMKAEGAKAGVPDITLPVARGDYHGLYIEMKAGKNKPTQKQWGWIDQLRRQNYAVHICYSWERARDVLVAYLEGDPLMQYGHPESALISVPYHDTLHFNWCSMCDEENMDVVERRET